jgi:hypothetical protein
VTLDFLAKVGASHRWEQYAKQDTTALLAQQLHRLPNILAPQAASVLQDPASLNHACLDLISHSNCNLPA